MSRRTRIENYIAFSIVIHYRLCSTFRFAIELRERNDSYVITRNFRDITFRNILLTWKKKVANFFL